MLRFSTMNWLLQAAIDYLDTGIMPEESLTEEELAYFNSSVAQIRSDREKGLHFEYSVGDYDDD